MLTIEQFGFVQVVSYDGVARFAYDLRTNPSTRISPVVAARHLQDFAAAILLSQGAPVSSSRAEQLAEVLA